MIAVLTDRAKNNAVAVGLRRRTSIIWAAINGSVDPA
jgi:hypothetical protein